MERSRLVFVTLLAGSNVLGCSNTTPPTPAPPSVTTKQAPSTAELEKVEAELSKLPAEDGVVARKQRVCPVSEELLGSMGPPKKVDVNGKQVWICCEGCREKLLGDPDKFLPEIN